MDSAADGPNRILDSLSEGVIALDSSWTLTYLNTEAERQLTAATGRPARDLIGKSLWREWPRLVGSRMDRQLRRAVRENTPVTFEDSCLVPGRRFLVRAHASADGLIVFTEEITAGNDAHDELRRCQEHFRALVEGSPDVIARVDTQLRYEYINPMGARNTGIPQQQFIGKTSDEVGIHEETVAPWRSACLAAIETMQPQAVETAFASPVGTSYYRINIVPEFGPDGSVSSLLSIAHDITDLRQAQVEVAAARTEAERRAAELESFISSIADGMVVLDLDGNVLYLNEAGRSILDVPDEQPIPNWMTGFRRYDLDGHLMPTESLACYWALQGQTATDQRTRMIAPWGKQVVVSASSSPVWDREGHVVGAVLVFRDQAERIAHEQERAEMYNREHNIARILQSALIPPLTSVEIEGCTAALRYEPGMREAEVGGDFYDVFELRGGKVGILIGDVAGKGLAAAAHVAAAKHAIRSYAYLFTSPARVMTLANTAVCRADSGAGMETNMLTMFFAVVDAREHTVTYASAGHEPPLLRRTDGSIEALDSIGGMAMGVLPNHQYAEATVSFGAGDTLVMVTDGVTEARPSSLQLFGSQGVARYLSQYRDTPLLDIPSGVLDAARAHGGGRLQDDAAVLALQCSAMPTDEPGAVKAA